MRVYIYVRVQTFALSVFYKVFRELMTYEYDINSLALSPVKDFYRKIKRIV